MSEDGPLRGWSLVAQREEAAPLIAALVELEPETEYTRSDIAETADVPLKTLYLVDTLDDLVDIGLLRRVDSDDEEACYVLEAESETLAAARQFDEAVADRLRVEAE